MNKMIRIPGLLKYHNFIIKRKYEAPIANKCVVGCVKIIRIRKYPPNSGGHRYEFDLEYKGLFKVDGVWLNAKEVESYKGLEFYRSVVVLANKEIRRLSFKEVQLYMRYFSIEIHWCNLKIKKVSWV